MRNEYDYRNRRISKKVDRFDTVANDWHLPERHDFVWDDWNIIHETVSTTNGGITTVDKYNCQNWAEEVRSVYNRIKDNQEIRKKCCEERNKK